jgi:hypothetical protein
MGATSGAGTAYPAGPPEFTPDFYLGSRYSIFSFMCMLCRSLFVLFRLAIVLSVLRFTDSDYPFGIFKLFLILLWLVMKHHEYVPISATTRNTAFHKNQPININQIYILKGVHSKSFGIELKKALCYISNISLIETFYSKLLIIFL